MRRMIHYHQKLEGVGFINVWQEYMQYLCEETGEEKWEPMLKMWEGEVKSSVLPTDDPSDISTFFPEHEGKAFFRWLSASKDALRFTGTGQLKRKGVDLLRTYVIPGNAER